MTIPIGRKGRVYAKVESAYGADDSLSSSNAVRHIELGFSFDPFARATSPEKRQSPGPVNRFDRKKVTELSTLAALMRPSGTLNVQPELHNFLVAAFGPGSNNITHTATVQASPPPTTTTATVDATGGIDVGQFVWINIGSAKYARVITARTGNDMTWAPVTPDPPGAGDTIVGTQTYQLHNQLRSLNIAHYSSNGFNRKLLGVMINQFGMTFDAAEEARFVASGPAQQQLENPTDPGAFTSVGGNPPSGLVGHMLTKGVATLIKNIEIQVTNSAAIRNQEFGVNNASEGYRSGRREVSLTIEQFADDLTNLYAPALAGTDIGLLLQTGDVVGNTIGVYMPRVEIKVPETDDPDEEASNTYAATALESVDGANDELCLGFL